MSTKKITKKERYEAIKALCEGNTEGIDVTGIMEFCDNEIAAIDARATKAKERKAAKKAEGDEMTETIFGVLTDEPATIDTIVAAIGDENITKGKVIYRLSSMAREGRVVKTEVGVEGADGKTKRVTAYSVA